MLFPKVLVLVVAHDKTSNPARRSRCVAITAQGCASQKNVINGCHPKGFLFSPLRPNIFSLSLLKSTPAPAMPDRVFPEGWPRASVPGLTHHLMPPREKSFLCFKLGPGRRHPLIRENVGSRHGGQCHPNLRT